MKTSCEGHLLELFFLACSYNEGNDFGSRCGFAEPFSKKKTRDGIYLALYGNVAFFESLIILSVHLFANDVIITVVCPLYLRKCRQTYPI